MSSSWVETLGKLILELKKWNYTWVDTINYIVDLWWDEDRISGDWQTFLYELFEIYSIEKILKIKNKFIW